MNCSSLLKTKEMTSEKKKKGKGQALKKTPGLPIPDICKNCTWTIMRHSNLEEPKIETEVLGVSLVRSLVRLHRLLVRSLAHSLTPEHVRQWNILIRNHSAWTLRPISNKWSNTIIENGVKQRTAKNSRAPLFMTKEYEVTKKGAHYIISLFSHNVHKMKIDG